MSVGLSECDKLMGLDSVGMLGLIGDVRLDELGFISFYFHSPRRSGPPKRHRFN